MDKVIIAAGLSLLSLSAFAQQQTPSLQAVTDVGRTTTNWIQITGTNGLGATGAGLELYANSTNAVGYVKVFNRSGGVPGTLKLQDSGGNTYMNENGGNVGIGNITPAAKLDVRGNMRVFDGMQGINFLTGTNTNAYALSVGVNDDGVNLGINSTVRGFKFTNTNGNLMFISPTGSVGMGTVTPLYTTTNPGLHVSKGGHSTIELGDPAAGYGGFVQTSDVKHRIFIGANLYDDQTNGWKNV